MSVTQPALEPVASQTCAPKRKRGRRLGLLFKIVRSILVIAIIGEATRVLFGNNLHVLLPGRVYRSGQLSGKKLAGVVRDHGIRTIVNLRGCCDPQEWYLEEAQTTHRLGIAQEDICLSAGRLPATGEMRRLLEVLDRAEYPILLHCRQGKDRTGLASTVVLLLQTEMGVPEARRQLGWRYGHLPLGRPANLDSYFDLYFEWLESRKLVHSPSTFRQWIDQEYCPGECRCVAEPLDVPSCIKRGEPVALRVRFHNTGIRTWQFRPGLNAGIHAGFVVWDAEGTPVVNAHAGLFEAEVAPGQSIDLTLVLPSLHKPGRYQLTVDLGDMRHCWFHQAGSEPLERDLEVQ